MRIETVSDVRLSPSPAVEAFLFDFAKVSTAYAYDWSKQESFAARAAYLNGGGYRGDRAAVAQALREYNAALGAGAETLANLDRLAQPGTLVVVTGQQPGIFTGPAYSIYKAITVIHLARQQSERLGVPVIPMFWVAGEDHDWHEVSAVLAPAGDGITRLALKESFEADRRSVGTAPIPASLTELLDEFAAVLPETEFKAGVLERVRAAAADPAVLDPARTEGRPTLDDWFSRLMTGIFDGTGLVLIDPVNPALRRLEAPFFAEVIKRHGQIDTALARGHARWGALGFTPTVERQPGNTNLFTYVANARLPVFGGGGGGEFWIRDREQMRWSTAELLDRAATHPELFSTNVVLRPVIQGFLLPDLACVCGPGEISYFGLYRDVFAVMDEQMPIIYPRESFTLVEPPLARILEKQELTVADVVGGLAEKRREFVEREDRLGITDLFEQFRTDFGSRYDHLVHVLMQLDPNLRFVTDENRKQIAVQVSKLEEKARQQHRKNLEVALRQFDRLKAQLAPDGLQERRVSLLPYLAKYGPDLVLRLIAETDLAEPWAHRVIYLGS